MHDKATQRAAGRDNSGGPLCDGQSHPLCINTAKGHKLQFYF